jgi:hypothetical protein
MHRRLLFASSASTGTVSLELEQGPTTEETIARKGLVDVGGILIA